MPPQNHRSINPSNGGAHETPARSQPMPPQHCGRRALQAVLEQATSAMQWLAPAVCILCQQTHQATGAICDGCDQRLPRNPIACPRCGLPSSGIASVTPRNRCKHCHQHRLYFAKTRAPFLMQTGIRDLIHLWKFQHQPQLSPLLAALFIREIFPTPPPTSPLILVPIPTQWRRQLRRGFDHTRVLAQAIGAAHPHSLPIKPWLRNTRGGASQHRLTRSARWHNQHQRFAASTDVKGHRVVLIDDVMTTGATVNAAAATCLEAGAKAVTIWCLARTPQPGAPLTRYHGGLCNGEAHHEPSLREPNAR